MIPAILSCVFVIYLYQTLNEKPEEQNPDSGVFSASSAGVDGLVARLDALQARLDRLVDESRKGPNA